MPLQWLIAPPSTIAANRGGDTSRLLAVASLRMPPASRVIVECRWSAAANPGGGPVRNAASPAATKQPGRPRGWRPSTLSTVGPSHLGNENLRRR
jgi:hypothetical protein